MTTWQSLGIREKNPTHFLLSYACETERNQMVFHLINVNSLSLWPPICYQGMVTTEWISGNAKSLPLNSLTSCNISCTVMFLPLTRILSQGPHHTWLKFGSLQVSCSQSDKWIDTSAFHIYTWNTSVLVCIATVFWSQVTFPAPSLAQMQISGPRQIMGRPAT